MSHTENGPTDDFNWSDAIGYSGLAAIRWVFGGMAGGIMATIILSDVTGGFAAVGFAVLVGITWIVELAMRRSAMMERI